MKAHGLTWLDDLNHMFDMYLILFAWVSRDLYIVHEFRAVESLAEALTAKDGSSLGSFHGPFMVQDVVTMPAGTESCEQ